VLTPLLVLALAAWSVWAALDAAQTPPGALRPNKAAWLALCLVPMAGPVAWLAVGRPMAADGPRPRSRRVIAPDDDPDFLRSLGNHPHDGE